MAKQVWNNPIDKNVDWGGDQSTGGAPVSGEMVQKFIKDTFEGKAGLFHYDATNNRYLVFADEDARDEYLLDPTQTDLIIGTFDAPFNYAAEINLTSAAYNAVFLGSTGNYIDFTFDIKNKQGASTGENVTVTYTFIRNATRQVVKEIRKFGDNVHFNVDKYLGEGTNTVIVGITGQTSLAATTVAITYQVVNLALTDDYDISKSYNLSSGAKRVEVPFTVSGYGTKIVEWYLDGELLPFVKSEDEVVDVVATRTKYIEIANLQQGTHSLQLRAYTVVNGEQFYTDTLYRDIIVYTGANNNVIIGVAVTIPRLHGILGANDHVAIYDMVQYVPYTLRFATYSPSNAANTEVVVSIDGKEMGKVWSVNNVENRFVITPSTAGTKTLKLSAPNVSKEIQTVIKETDMDISEIDNGLVLNFTAEGKTYNSPDRGYWTDGVHNATLSGFNWNETSGWFDGRLEMSAGSSIQFDYSPLAGNPTATGKTIEIEWSTKNVVNDDAVICDLRGDDGVGILITATKVSMKSADGVVVETEYKSDENVRIGFVINQVSGTTNQRLSFIYANGILSRCEKWAQADSYTSDKMMKFTATEEAEVSLKSIRIYDTALTSDNMLNNFILYRDTIAEMMEVYDRNDVYEEGTTTFSPDKMMGRLPVMIVTGDIPTLENTSDTDTQIVVDIEYYNMQDTSKSFTMKNAAMRPQGTSSMGYPKKNFRIYTQKVENTVLYDADGKVVEDKLYSFKKGAQPVNCWCLKADYAESSGTHNTGIARLWNEALFNAMVTIDLGKNNEHNIDNKPILRTEAQKAAILAKYPYDVRTAIDGFPILLFYRPSVNDDLIFIGKYNFNNDKSTESVFGFKGIPNFNNSKMQCWEVLNNGNALALFTTVDGFDEDWSKAFESRYPDTKTPYTGDLKAFCEWMVNVSQKDFATQKWEHLNVYMMAAYWCYLMRHAAADQFVKNAMFTSEDGQHFYYILYDNDTINGLINTGHLRIKPTDDRNTVDESGSHVFAGYDSRLWNMLENDEEFISIVSAVDNALYSAGISYANTIKIFDKEQADKWVERVYNQDAQYKYVGPYVEKGIDNLFMLQGKRDLHRRWWLAKRFSIYDAKYVSGEYKSKNIELKCIDETPAGLKFKVTSGYPLDYGYGINNVPREFGVYLNNGESHTFETKEKVFRGDPIRIYGAPHLSEIDLSLMSDKLAVVTIGNVYDESLGTRLTKLVIGNADKVNVALAEISGLKQAASLEYLDIQGITKMTSLDLSNHAYFKTLKAKGSGISSVSFAKGAPVERLELPSTMRVLSLNQLPYLEESNIVFENIANLQQMHVSACPNVTDNFSFVYNWVTNKTTSDGNCSITMDSVNWSGVSGEQMLKIASLGNVSLKGKVVLTDITEEQGDVFVSVFGDHVFDENAEFFIDAPITVTVSGQTSLLEGESATYTAKVYPPKDGTIRFSLPTTRTGCSINATTGALTTTENGLATSNVVVRATFTPSNGDAPVIKDYAVSVIKRTYPTDATIEGEYNPIDFTDYNWFTNTSGVNGDMVVSWSLSGDIIDYVRIKSQDAIGCVLEMTYPPLGVVNGTLTLTLKKAYNGATILTATKTLSAELSGVIITGRSNSPIQAALYNAGLVANETHTFKHEAEKITASQLQTGTTASTSVFYSQRNDITSFDEFRYFTGVKTVPAHLFSGLLKMESITLPDNLTSLGNNIFYNCKMLSSVAIPEGVVSIGGNVFDGCEELTDVSIPSTLVSMGNNVFPRCGKLNISVSDNNGSFKDINGVLFNAEGTKIIAFAKDKIQTTYTIPIGVITIGGYCFTGCQSLTSLVIPSTVTTIHNRAFSAVGNLNKITIDAITAPSVTANTFGDNTNSSATYTGYYTRGTNKLYIPQNAVGYEASYWLDPLQNADKGGFSIHGKLTIVSNKSNATFSIKYTTISGASKTVTASVGTCYLADIKYGTSLTATPNALGDNVFDSASTTITYNGAATITNNAYFYPKNATIVGDENPVKNNTYTWSTTTANVDGAYVGTWALSGDITAYISIESQDSNQCKMKVAEAPTEFVSGTLTLTLKRTNGTTLATATKSLKAILEGVVITSKSNAPIQAALYEAGLVANQNYSLQSEVEKITADQLGTHYDSIFYSRREEITHFEEFAYFTGVTEIKQYMIHSLDNLQRIVIPEGVTKLETYAINACGSLVEIVLPSSLRELSNKVFRMVGSLTSLTIPEGVTTLNTSALTGTDIQTLYLPSTLTLFAEACASCDKLTTVVLAEGLSFIDKEAFSGCSSLRVINLPESITSIGETAFYGTAIESIVIPENVTTIGKQAFLFCRALKNITLPSRITTLPHRLFEQCSSLERITVPSSVTTIGSSCFSGCVSMKEMVFLPVSAPLPSSYNAGSGVFGDNLGTSSSMYTGYNTRSTGENILRIPSNATGYDTGHWIDPLQNPDKCGFSIYGKLTINSNKSDAKFNVTYTTVDGTLKAINVGVGTWYLNDIKYDTEMTIALTSGGSAEEGNTQTFVYSLTSQSCTFTFIIGSWITIDQTITDPASMISGDVNGEHIQLIRSNTHRYAGKYSSDTMKICQLDDSNSNYLYNGTQVTTNSNSIEFYVRIPKFWYRVVSVSNDVYKIGFYYGDERPDDTWRVFNGNSTLIGMFPADISGSVAYTRVPASDKVKPNSSVSSSITKITKKGNGFNLYSFDISCMVYLLFIATYGTTNVSGVLGKVGETNLYNDLGNTFSIGMKDSKKGDSVNNFMGLEKIISATQACTGAKLVSTSSEGDFYCNDILAYHTSVLGSGWVSKIFITEEGYIFPIEMTATSTTSFCVAASVTKSGTYIPQMNTSLLPAHYNSTNPGGQRMYYRVIYRGTIQEVTAENF